MNCVFFFQAEDGIRDYDVTGVQTCALPIFGGAEKHGNRRLQRRLVGRLCVRPRHKLATVGQLTWKIDADVIEFNRRVKVALIQIWE